MKPKIKDYFTKEFILFVCCNGFAAVLNFFSRILFNTFMGYMLSVVFAYCIGMVTAFTLDKLFVFKAGTHKTVRQAMGFVMINLLSLGQTLLFSWLFRSVLFPWLGFTFYPDEVAHLIGITIPIFTSFLGHKYFSFGAKAE